MQSVETLHDKRRQWLAAALRGERPAWDEALGAADDVLAAAIEEGVAPLVNQQMIDASQRWLLPAGLREGLAAETRGQVVANLLRESEIREIFETLAASGLNALLLKGSALAYWAYELPHLRPCVDIDLLFDSRGAAEAARLALGRNGYVPLARALAGDLVAFEIGCFRDVAGTRIHADLHWNIGSMPFFADRFAAEELFQSSIALPQFGLTARAIGRVHGYLHNVVHRAVQLNSGTGDRLKWHGDLHRLAAHFSAADWDELASLSEQRGLAGVCHDALCASTSLFHSTIPPAFIERLSRARSREVIDVRRLHSWRYVEYLNFRSLPTLKQRLSWLKQRAIPDPLYLDDMYGGRWRGYGRYLRKGMSKLLGRGR